MGFPQDTNFIKKQTSDLQKRLRFCNEEPERVKIGKTMLAGFCCDLAKPPRSIGVSHLIRFSPKLNWDAAVHGKTHIDSI